MSTGTLGSGGKNNHNEHQFQVLFDCGMEVPMGWFRGSDFRWIPNCLKHSVRMMEGYCCSRIDIGYYVSLLYFKLT